jgi:hypothetical protein
VDSEFQSNDVEGLWWLLSPSAAGSFRVSRGTRLDRRLRIRSDGAVLQAIVQALMISLTFIVLDKLAKSAAQVCFAERNDSA